MFTGIIESTGLVSKIQEEGENIHFTIQSDISNELKVDQSVAHNGVCLTVVDLDAKYHTVTAIKETLEKSNLAELTVGSVVNLERCMLVNSRLDGHMVQGHVDTKGKVLNIFAEEGSWEFQFDFDSKFRELIVEKGSICVNGVSLTAFNVGDSKFSVAIIPYTFDHTSFKNLKAGDSVNLEFDILGKYVQRILSARS